MSDLSQALIDAAAAAFPVDPCNPDDTETVADWELISTTEEGRREEPNLPEMYAVPIWGPVEPIAAQAVAAVLDALATHTAPTPPDGPARVGFLNHEELRRLAAEVREVSS